MPSEPCECFPESYATLFADRSFSPQWEERVLPVDDVARVFNLHQRARALPLQNSVHTHTHSNHQTLFLEFTL